VQSVYFDVNIFCDLFFDGGRYFACLPRLRDLVAANRLRVLGSEMQFGELFGLINHDAEQYRCVSDAALNLIGRHFLCERVELCMKELRKHGPLSPSEACIDPALLNDVRGLVANGLDGRAVSTEVREAKGQFLTAFETAAARATEQLPAFISSRNDLRRELGNDWHIDKAQVDDLMQSSDFLRDVLGPLGAEEISRWELPVLRSWFGYIIAHAWKTIVDDRRIEPADHADWEHYACAAIAGLLVTQDKKFREIARHINLGYVRAVTFEQFLESIP
jgi:hypothetical protein